MDKDEMMNKLTAIFKSHMFGQELKAIHDYFRYSSNLKKMIIKSKIVRKNKFGRFTDRFVQKFVRDNKYRNNFVIYSCSTDINGNEVVVIQNKMTLQFHYFRFFKDPMQFTLS